MMSIRVLWLSLCGQFPVQVWKKHLLGSFYRSCRGLLESSFLSAGARLTSFPRRGKIHYLAAPLLEESG